jgi:hypothetical protein
VWDPIEVSGGSHCNRSARSLLYPKLIYKLEFKSSPKRLDSSKSHGRYEDTSTVRYGTCAVLQITYMFDFPLRDFASMFNVSSQAGLRKRKIIFFCRTDAQNSADRFTRMTFNDLKARATKPNSSTPTMGNGQWAMHGEVLISCSKASYSKLQ